MTSRGLSWMLQLVSAIREGRRFGFGASDVPPGCSHEKNMWPFGQLPNEFLFTIVHHYSRFFFSFPPRSFLPRVSVSWFCIPNIFPINWLIVMVNNIYFILSISFYPFSRPMICQHSFPIFFRPLGPSSQLEMVLTISCWLPDQIEFRPAYFWVVSPPCLVL